MVKAFPTSDLRPYGLRLAGFGSTGKHFPTYQNVRTKETMKQTIENLPIESNEAKAKAEAQAKQAAARLNAIAEANAFTAVILAATVTDAGKVGELTIDALAHTFGDTASVQGNPTPSAWFALVAAMSAPDAENRVMTHERRTDVVRKAMAAHKAKFAALLKGPDAKKFKPCATQKATAGYGKGSASYALKVPANVKIVAE